MSTFFRKHNRTSQKGIALYIAISVTGALILVAFAIIELALKQIAVSSAGRDSQEAFYAADSGSECAVFWDIKNPTNPGTSAFSTTSVQAISCNSLALTPSLAVAPAGNGTSTFTVTFAPDPYCAVVTVVKYFNGNTPATRIESRGYNSCDNTAFQRVERAIRIDY